MKNYSMLALLCVTLGGCSALAPKGGDQNLTVLPEDPTQERVVVGEGEALPEGAIVLPADESAGEIEVSVTELPDAEVVEVTELDAPAETEATSGGTEIYLPDEVAASADAEAVIIPAEDHANPEVESQGELSPDGIRVEIVNASGIPGLEQQVSERLAGKGYFISWAGESAATGHQVETLIRYRPGFAREAVRLGHILPGNQIVTRAEALPEEIDIRVIVGSDQQ